MKQFVIKLSVFLIGVLFINGVLSTVVTWPKYYSPYLDRYSNHEETENTMLLLADSHGAAVDQRFLVRHDIANVAEGSDSYADMYIKLADSIRSEEPVSAILLSADDHTLSKYRNSLNNLPRSVLLAEWADIRTLLSWSYSEYFRKKWVHPYIPMVSSMHAEFTRKFVSQNLRRVLDIGNVDREEPPWITTSDEYRRKMSKKRYENQFAPGKSVLAVNWLDSILNLAEENDIFVIGVRFPLAPEYIEQIGYENFGADRILRERGFRVIDLKHMFMDRPEMFKDTDHVNDRGAKLLVEKLVENLNTRMIQK